MAETKILKLGDDVTIAIKTTASKKAKVSKRPEKRYGPIRRIEEPDSGQGRLKMIFYDLSCEWIGFLPHISWVGVPSGNTRPNGIGVMAYIPLSAGRITVPTSGGVHNAYVAPATGIFCPDLSELYIGHHFNQYQQRAFDRLELGVPAVNPTEPTYRLVDRCWPVPYRNVDQLGLTVKLGGRSFLLKESRSDWQPRLSAEKRLASATDSEVIANLGKEIAESAFLAGEFIDYSEITPNMWFVAEEIDQRSLFRDWGEFTPRLRRGSYSLALENSIYFEPFDMADTANFKVVRRFKDGGGLADFNDAEVTPDQLRPSVMPRTTRVYMVPQFWHFRAEYTAHWVDRWDDINPDTPGNPSLPDVEIPFTIPNRVNDGYMPAFASPLVRCGWNTGGTFEGSGLPVFVDHPSFITAWSEKAYDPEDTSDDNYKLLMMLISNWQKRSNTFDYQDDSPPGPSTTRPSGGDYQWASATLRARSDGTIRITQEGAPAGMLVAAVEFEDDNNHRYWVFRKTTRVADVLIYDGPYDDPEYFNGALSLPVTTISHLLPVTSASYTPSNYPPNRWPWETGGLQTDGEWPVLELFRTEYPE